MIFLVIILTLIGTLLWYIRHHQNYFENRNVKYLKSPPFLGSLYESIIGRKGVYDNVLDIYNTPELKDEPYFGIFMFHKPALLIKEPEIIKKILITDFNNFNTRHTASDNHDPIGFYQLFLSKYPEWKQIRPKISPFFSSAKLKQCYHLVDKLGNDLNQYITKRLDQNNSVELNMKVVTDFFFVDVISSVAFGVEAHSLENSGSEFSETSNTVFKYTFHRGLEFMCNFLLPELMKTFNFKNVNEKASKFIYKVCSDIVAEREKSGTKRNDLIDLLIELKKDLKPTYAGHTVEDMMYAQVAIFLLAGEFKSFR